MFEHHYSMVFFFRSSVSSAYARLPYETDKVVYLTGSTSMRESTGYTIC